MFKLQTGYVLTGFIIGLMLLYNIFISSPDKKLHIIVCNVGQGDSVYIKFPDGRDMLVDGGPDMSVLKCLGNYMPFWDRHLDMVLLTHPQKDHMQGLPSVLERYQVDYFMQSDIRNNTEGFHTLISLIQSKRIKQKILESGEKISIGNTYLQIMWPSVSQVATMRCLDCLSVSDTIDNASQKVLGAVSDGNLNDGSVVFTLSYGSFTAFFPSDADINVEDQYIGLGLPDDYVEFLKVPHHGSKTGMSHRFIDWIKPGLAVISVGKNTYGHPSKEALDILTLSGSRIVRTDQHGDIEITSDGTLWSVN